MKAKCQNLSKALASHLGGQIVKVIASSERCQTFINVSFQCPLCRKPLESTLNTLCITARLKIPPYQRRTLESLIQKEVILGF